jgi:hypothetical protein
MRDGGSFCFERWTRSKSFGRKQLLIISFNFREKKKKTRPLHASSQQQQPQQTIHNKETSSPGTMLSFSG